MKEWYQYDSEEWDNLVAANSKSNSHYATLPAVATTKNTKSTTTPEAVVAQAEQFKSFSSGGQSEQAMDAVVAQFKNGFGARDISGMSPTVATTAFGATEKSFVDKNGAITTDLGNFSKNFPDQIKEFTSSLTSATNALKTTTGELKRDGLAFVAGTTKKLFEGIDLPGTTDFKSFKNLGTGQLYKLAGLGEEAFKSVNEGLKAVTSSLGEVYQAANEGLQAITSTVSEVGGAVLGPIKDVVGAAYTLSDPRLANLLVQSNLDFLPPNIRSMLGSKAQSAVSGVTGNFHNKAESILNKAYTLNNILDTVSAEGLLYGVYQTGNGVGGYSGYNSISGNGGVYLPGQSSYSGTHSQYGSLAAAVASLCGKDPVEGTYRSYSDEKDLYDILLAAALQTNAGQIVAGLMSCGNGTQYNDGRSLNIVRRNTSNIVSAGDTYTYRALTEQYGSDFTTSPTDDVLALYANAPNTPEAQADLQQIALALNVNTDSLLLEKSFTSTTVYDGGKVAAIQCAEQTTQADFLSADDYAAINAATTLYRSDAVLV